MCMEKSRVITWLLWLKAIPITVPFYAGTVVCVFVLGAYLTIGPPSAFPSGTIITIDEGGTLSSIATQLEEERIVRYAVVFDVLVRIVGDPSTLKAGDYAFHAPVGAYTVATRILTGDFGIHPVKVTIPEGATSYQIANILEKSLYAFNAGEFLTLAEKKEGYLFPDTYFFLPTDKPKKIVREMENTFYVRTEHLAPLMASSSYSVNEILTIASLVEKEARKLETRRVIAGIIENRLAINMPLQIDAVFGYIKRTKTFHPLHSDLEVDSPYNVYKYKGLPPGPIANPGLSSIEAVLTPTKSNYLFYLTGDDGKMYYSSTFAGHIRNRQLHLD